MRYLLSLLCFLNLHFTPLAYADNISQIQADLTDLLNTADPNVNVSIAVKDEASGQVIYARYPDRNLVPGSNMKLFTAAAALLGLPIDYTFETTLYATSPADSNNRITGDVYFKFTGDPDFSAQDLRNLIKTMANSGVKTITGQVYLDTTQFGGDLRAPGWPQDDRYLCYSAPVDAVIIDRNCYRLTIIPDKNRQNVRFHSNNPYLPIDNYLSHGTKKACGPRLSVGENDHYQMKGCIPNQTVGQELVVVNPAYYASTLLSGLLREEGIAFNGSIVKAKTPPDLAILAQHRSEPLPKLIYRMLKHSDNLIAETLLKTLGHDYYNQSGSWQNGSQARRAVLAQFGVKLEEAVMVDGSGLSHNNLISANQLLRLLDFTYHTLSIRPDFVRSLPLGGIDGTLKRRLTTQSVRGRVLAKTGTLSHVTSLAGYIITANKKVLAFAILSNPAHGNTFTYKRLEDKIVAYLATSSP